MASVSSSESAAPAAKAAELAPSSASTSAATSCKIPVLSETERQIPAVALAQKLRREGVPAQVLEDNDAYFVVISTNKQQQVQKLASEAELKLVRWAEPEEPDDTLD